MLPTERISFDPIVGRKKQTLPDGARMAVWVIVNVEEWDIQKTMPRTVLTPPAGGSPMPDIPNWAWHEYGNRVGFWRLLETLDNLKITAALAINGTAIKAYEPISRAAVERKWEFIGHGLTQTNMQHVKNEREDIIATRAAIERIAGRRPRGWLGPGLTETWETPDLLIEEGFDYVCDWVLDDQPVWLKTRTKPILNVPYTQECNDVAMMLIQHHAATEYRNRAIDQFNQIYSDSAELGPHHGACRAPLYHGRAAPVAVLPRSARAYACPQGRGVLDRRAHPRLVRRVEQASLIFPAPCPWT